MLKISFIIFIFSFTSFAKSNIDSDSIPNKIDGADGSSVMNFNSYFQFDGAISSLESLSKYLQTLSHYATTQDSTKSLKVLQDYKKNDPLIYLTLASLYGDVQGTLLSQELKIKKLELQLAISEGANDSIINTKEANYKSFKTQVERFWESHITPD